LTTASMERRSLVRWLLPAANHPKHLGLAHPLAAAALGLAGTTATAIAAHDLFFAGPSQAVGSSALDVLSARGLWTYLGLMLAARAPTLGLPRLCYEMLWGCNIALVVVAIALQTGRPRLASAAGISVSVDQVLWWVDVATALATKAVLGGQAVWPIGVAKYMSWPETTWPRKLSSSHHLWFLPLVMFTAGIPSAPPCAPGALQLFARLGGEFALSLVLMACAAAAARCLTPFRMPPEPAPGDAPSSDRRPASVAASVAASSAWDSCCGGANASVSTSAAPRTTIRDMPEEKEGAYLNINLVYEVWKDLERFPILQVSHPRGVVHVPRLLCIWATLNVPCTTVLAVLSLVVPPRRS